MTNECQQYQPGRVNINPKEARVRRESAILASMFSLIVFAFLVLVDAETWFYVALFPSVWLAVIGYLQATNRFCVRFGVRGKQNADNHHSPLLTTVSDEAKYKDRKKSYLLMLCATITAAVITALAAIVA
ncbi:TPA: hypothetical protein EYO12_01655 [Candidatus Saccharibacteria bacterium]|nr:hypothetical protein [Candidatus Saccharibacteria bacterium]HIO87423.1 hypothetical protein [Candidatus Saccharibacteria bacterium]